MQHRHTIFAAALLAAALPAARAQGNFTVYGLIDAAVEHYTNADAAGNSLTRMPSLGGGMFPSRLGLRGAEDLGGGLKAIFTLENGFAPDTGTVGQGGRLFGRQAWVGLAGNWGQLTLGRTYNMMTQSTYDFDSFGPSQYGIGSLDSFIPNGRADNSVAYRGTFSGVTAGLQYSLGRDTSSAGGPAGTNCPGEAATDSRQCREWSVMLRYDGAQWSAVAAYDRIYGGPTASGGLKTSALADRRLHVAALYKTGDWKLSGGILSRDNDGVAATPKSRLSYLGAVYQVNPQLAIDGQVGRLDVKNSPNDTRQVLLRAIYTLSTRTSLYVAAGRLENDGAAALSLTAGGTVGAGLSQTGIITGIKHSF